MGLSGFSYYPSFVLNLINTHFHSMHINNSTLNGQLFFCFRHNLYHLEFGNLFLRLSHEELIRLTEYICSIDYNFYLEKNQHSQNRRKLLIHIDAGNKFLALTKDEFLELRNLVADNKSTGITDNINLSDYNTQLN